GRVYSRAALHTGATLKLREAWTHEASSTATGTAPGATPLSTNGHNDHRRKAVALVVAAVVLGGVVALVSRDVIIGIAVGAAGYAVGARVMRSRPASKDL